MENFVYKYSKYFFVLPWLCLFIASIFTLSQSIGRGMIVLFILVIWFLIALKYTFSLELFLYTLLISSFNITITFNNLTDCFVKGVYINYICPTAHILDIVIILNIFLFISVQLSLHFKTVKQIRDKKKANGFINLLNIFKPFVLVIPFYIYSIIHILLHPDLITAISMLRLNLYISLIPIFGNVIKYFVNNETQLSKVSSKEEMLLWNKKFIYIFLFLLLTICIQLVIGMYQFIRGTDLGLQLLGESNLLSGTINTSFLTNSLGLFLRSYGTFPHPNVLGGFALVIAILAYILLFAKKKLYFFIILLTSGLLIILTFSRTAVVLYIGFVILSVYESFKQKGNIFSIVPLFFDRFIKLNLGETSVVDRVNLIKASLEIFKDNWVLGVGNTHFISNLESYNVTTSSGLSLLQPVHNIFILILVEHGIIGGIFTIVFLAYLKVRQSISYLIDKKLFVYSIFIITLIGMLDHYLLTIPQGIFIFCLLLMI